MFYMPILLEYLSHDPLPSKLLLFSQGPAKDSTVHPRDR